MSIVCHATPDLKLAGGEPLDPVPPARPRLDPAAFHGPAGELVKLIEPATEADPAGLLASVLVGFGSIVGRSAYYQVEGDRHHANEFCVLVGPSSRGRKGTSWGRAKGVLAAADPVWGQANVVSGLSSGEGLMYTIRDPLNDDEGVEDKRLLVVESEFSGVLRQAERSGNILSAVMRDAWDGVTMRVLTRTTPAKVTAPHVSLIGHITAEELRRLLTATDAANGFANRHLFVWSERSRLLPDGGEVDPGELAEFGERFRQAAEFGRTAGRIARDNLARDLWHHVYPVLSSDRPGLAGKLTLRAEAHALRLSLLYALLDCSPVITAAHLQAALGMVEYAADTALHVFGDATGDPLADDIRKLLLEATAGLTRTEINRGLGGHKAANQIDLALKLLASVGQARGAAVATGGRSAERWHATRAGPSSACFAPAA